jgi:hypothetical protein
MTDGDSHPGPLTRHYARTDPAAVRAYPTAQAARLSPSPIRKNTKHL